jgi:PilZ domain
VYSDRAMWSTRLIDISLNGALVERPAGWTGQSGKAQRLELRVASGLIISVGAAVAHVSDKAIGYHFERMDLDSFTRLKRLIELNLGDPEMLNRELAALGH